MANSSLLIIPSDLKPISIRTSFSLIPITLPEIISLSDISENVERYLSCSGETSSASIPWFNSSGVISLISLKRLEPK